MMNIVLFAENAINFLGNYSYLIVIIFGIAHGITDNPWSFLTMGLSLTLVPLPIAYPLLLISNYIGATILYYGIQKINKKSQNYLYEKRVSKKILIWLEQQQKWKHIVVIGMPLVPTIQLRIALPFSKISFKQYSIIILGAYGFLYSAYSLVYFGVLSFLTDTISETLGVILLFLFCIFIYFGKTIRNKLFNLNQIKEVKHEN